MIKALQNAKTCSEEQSRPNRWPRRHLLWTLVFFHFNLRPLSPRWFFRYPKNQGISQAAHWEPDTRHQITIEWLQTPAKELLRKVMYRRLSKGECFPTDDWILKSPWAYFDYSVLHILACSPLGIHNDQCVPGAPWSYWPNPSINKHSKFNLILGLFMEYS